MIWIKPPIHYEPQGIALPIAQTSAPSIQSSLEILPPWAPYKKRLAWINVEYHTLKEDNASAKKTLQKAIELTKQTGADGLVMLGIGYQPPVQTAELAMFVLKGIAVEKN